MVMCHLWADDLGELLAMADRIGVARKHLQRPPKASWVHFDICLAMKAKVIAAGAVLTDKYGPLEHEARANGNHNMVDTITRLRARRGCPSNGSALARG
jgi:hypothetical protein